MNGLKNNLQHDNRNRAGKDTLARHGALATVLLACTALVATTPARADETWTGANGTNWFDPGNWSTGVPGSGDAVFINPVGAAKPVVLGGGSAQSAFLYVGTQAGSNGDLTIRDGGSLVNSGIAGIGYTAGDGIVTVTGQGSQWTNLGALTVSFNGNGVLRVLDGAKVSAASVIVGYQSNTITGEVVVDGNGSTFSTGGDYVIAHSGIGSTTVSNGATLDVGGKIVIGEDPGSSGTLTIGGLDSSFNPQAAGTVKAAGGIHFGQGTAPGLIIRHNGSNYIFDAALIDAIGSGTFSHYGGTTVYTGDGSAFTGSTNIAGSTLIVNSTLFGDTFVQGGGVLGGTGTLENVYVSDTIMPGSASGMLGTLWATGNVVLYGSSVYDVDVRADGSSDLIAAQGTVTIDGGALRVSAGAGSYSPATVYTIIQANNIARNTDFTVTSNLAFLTPSVIYNASSVDLTMTRNATALASVGLTPNQIATAGGVDSLSAGSPVQDAVLGLTAEQAQDAFDQLSGEIHGSAHTAMLEDSRFLRNAVNDRMRAAAGTAEASVWGQAFGSRGRWNGDGNAARVSRSIGGFFAGGDAPAFDSWRFGAVTGYSHSSFDAKDRNSSGKSDNYHIGLYGGTAWGDLALRTGAAYTLHDISTKRAVNFAGFSENLKGDYRAGTAQVFGELGYSLKADAATFEPFVNLAHVSHRTNGFTEKGGTAALSAGSETTAATFTTLGLRASTDFTLGGVTATARGTVGWRHAFGDTDALSTLRFAGGSAFTVAGVPLARNTAVIDGLDFALTPAATLGVAYGGQFGSGLADQSIKASVNVKF